MSTDAYAAMAQARANEVESFTTADGLDVQAYAEHLRQRDRDFQEEVRDTARLAAADATSQFVDAATGVFDLAKFKDQLQRDIDQLRPEQDCRDCND